VDLELNAGISRGPYKFHVETIKARSVFPVPSAQFTNSAGEHFNIASTKPRKITIRCTAPEGKGFCEGEWE